MKTSRLALIAVALIGGPFAAAAQTDRADRIHTRILRSDGQVVDVISEPRGTTVHVDREWRTSTNDASNDRHADYIDRWTRDDPDARVSTQRSGPRERVPTGRAARGEN